MAFSIASRVRFRVDDNEARGIRRHADKDIGRKFRLRSRSCDAIRKIRRPMRKSRVAIRWTRLSPRWHLFSSLPLSLSLPLSAGWMSQCLLERRAPITLPVFAQRRRAGVGNERKGGRSRRTPLCPTMCLRIISCCNRIYGEDTSEAVIRHCASLAR